MKTTKLYAKKTLSVFMAVLMLMSAWVFVPGEHNHASAVAASQISTTNSNAVRNFTDSSFNTSFTTVSGNFHGDNASTMASRGYYKNVLYSPHFPASNNNLTNNDAGVYFGTLGGTADGARVWYPETTLIWDGSTTPQIPILFDIDSNNNNRVGVKNVYISSGANGLVFRDSYWTAKSECAKDTNYYTHFTFDWIMQNNSGNYWISTSSGNDKESMCSSKGYWDIYGTYLQYTGGSFGSGSTYYKAITPTWVCRTGSNYTGTTNKTIYVIDYVPLKNALNNVKTLINEVKNNPAKYTNESVNALVDAANKLIAAKPNNYIDGSNNNVLAWNSAVSTALSAYNSAKNLVVQQYNLTFKKNDGTTQTTAYPYGTAIDYSKAPANTTPQGNNNGHVLYTWNQSYTTVTDDITITEKAGQTTAHTYGAYNTDYSATQHSRTCTVCGYTNIQNHDKTEGLLDGEDTCTTSATQYYDCSICGKKNYGSEEINFIKGHNFTGEIVENVTGENGNHWQKCLNCDAHGWNGTINTCQDHNWDKDNNGVKDAADAIETKASTCKEEGYEKYQCTVCSATYTKTLDLVAHKTTKTVAKLKSCGVDGHAEYWTCSVCDRMWKNSALTEEFDNTDADNDGIYDAVEIKADSHVFDGDVNIVSTGWNGAHNYKCSLCGKAYGVNGVTDATETHSWDKNNDGEITVDDATTVVAATCIKTGTATYNCTVCKQSVVETLEKVSHKMTEIPAIEAACGVEGNNKYYSCSICSKFYKDEAGTIVTTAAEEKIEALEHKWTAAHDYDTFNTAATCQSPAIYNKHCDYCKVKLSGSNSTYLVGEADKVNGHKFDGEIRKNDDKTHSYKCTVAGCTEYGNATNCTYEKTAEVASTCKTRGYITYTCTTCGNGYSDYKELDFTNHEGETEVRFAVDAKCNTNGYTGDTYCLGCNTKIATGEAIIADKTKHPHEDMKDYEGLAATCQTEGYKAYKYCAACGTYGTEKTPITKKAHSYGVWTKLEGEDKHTRSCTTCDASVAAIATETAACTGGTANCVDKAVCSTCGGAYGNINSANHKTVVTVPKLDSTCQTEGYEAYRHCDACNKDIEAITPIAKKAHTYGAWTKLEGVDKHTRSCKTCKAEVAEVATETADCNGGTAYCNALAKCADCKAEYGTYDAANHKSEAWTLVGAKAESCTEKGYTGDKVRNCCNTVYEYGEEIAMLEHSYTVEVEGSRVAATCNKKGSVTKKCASCTATKLYELDIDSKNHASSETITVGAYDATCTTDGFTGNVYYVCCYSDAEGADNSKALVKKGEKIKANGVHVLGAGVPEYMIESIDENGKVTLKTTEPTYAEKIAKRHLDGKWYHVQICEECESVVYSTCYTYAHTYNCVDTDICEICAGLCSLIDPDKHKNGLAEVEGKAATCMKEGVKSYYECDACDNTYLDAAGKQKFDYETEASKLVIAKVAHGIDWANGTVVKEASCGENGVTRYFCSTEGCNHYIDREDIATTGSHVWSTEYTRVKEPTCNKNGNDAILCTICKAVKPNSYVTVPATGEHNYDANGDGTVDKNDAEIIEGESCQKPGQLIYTCQNENCSFELVETDTEGVSAHQWGEWVTIGGDCSSGVLQQRSCEKCSEKQQQTITTESHSYVVKVRVEATAEKDGYVIYACENCGHEKAPEVIKYEGPDAGEHVVDYSQYVVISKATCTEAEKREYTCIRCGEKVVYYEGEKLDHVWVTQAAQNPSCEEDGHNEYSRCVLCSTEEGKVAIEKLGHKDDDGNGKCDRCNGAYYTEGDSTKSCNCICHKEGWFMKFIYKIVNFFWKLFKIGHSCDCGAVHY